MKDSDHNSWTTLEVATRNLKPDRLLEVIDFERRNFRRPYILRRLIARYLMKQRAILYAKCRLR